MLKKIIKLFIYSAMVFTGFSIYVKGMIPSNLYIVPGDEVQIKSLPIVSFESQNKSNSKEVAKSGQKLKYEAKLFGVVPIKEVNVTTTENRKVSVAGTPFGIKMFSNGVMIVGFSEVLTSTGYQSPAKLAGLKMGDVIMQLDNFSTKSNNDVENYIQKNAGKPINVIYMRDGIRSETVLVPVLDKNTQTYRTGMWVRDSSAGVGTMTFYDVQKGMFAGLGHGIKDTDTQKDIPLLSGEIVPVKIVGLTKSQNGHAGELKGTFMSNFPSGKVLANIPNGVYGKIFNVPKENIMDVVTPQEIEPGPAQIITTINGTKPESYNIIIEKISLTSTNMNKNMIIRITDDRLLSLTGGIVQGMSGSPIVQNGKLVGAVTHVFVNQVDRGYGIFAQNMLDTLDGIERNNSLEKAG